MLTPKSKIFVTGHNGMVGSSLCKILKKKKFKKIITVDKKKLDLRNKEKVEKFFKKKKIDIVVHCAGKVGGIIANNNYKADFLKDNLKIQNNVILSALKFKVKQLIFISSSSAYPKSCKQPIKEKYFLKGELEETNRAYAIAKIAGIELCRCINEQYGTRYISLMIPNLFGANDNYRDNNSHFIAAIIRKIHYAIINKKKTVYLLGDGSPLRECAYVDEISEAIIFILKNSQIKDYLINVGSGDEYSIKDYAKIISNIFQYNGQIKFDKNINLNGVRRKILSTNLLKSYGWKKKYQFKKAFNITIKNFIKTYK